jgi:hypothetical protein
MRHLTTSPVDFWGRFFFWTCQCDDKVLPVERQAATIAFWKYFGNIPSSQSQRDRSHLQSFQPMGSELLPWWQVLRKIEVITLCSRILDLKNPLLAEAEVCWNSCRLDPIRNQHKADNQSVVFNPSTQFWLGAYSYTKGKVSSWKSQCAHAWIISPGIFLLFQCVCRIQGGWINSQGPTYGAPFFNESITLSSPQDSWCMRPSYRVEPSSTIVPVAATSTSTSWWGNWAILCYP